jgi:hypothetical protein
MVGSNMGVWAVGLKGLDSPPPFDEDVGGEHTPLGESLVADDVPVGGTDTPIAHPGPGPIRMYNPASPEGVQAASPCAGVGPDAEAVETPGAAVLGAEAAIASVDVVEPVEEHQRLWFRLVHASAGAGVSELPCMAASLNLVGEWLNRPGLFIHPTAGVHDVALLLGIVRCRQAEVVDFEFGSRASSPRFRSRR